MRRYTIAEEKALLQKRTRKPSSRLLVRDSDICDSAQSAYKSEPIGSDLGLSYNPAESVLRRKFIGKSDVKATVPVMKKPIKASPAPYLPENVTIGTNNNFRCSKVLAKRLGISYEESHQRKQAKKVLFENKESKE